MMVMTTTNMDFNIAVAQFNDANSPAIESVIAALGKIGGCWYIFDETADKEFELKLLCDNYDLVFEYVMR